MARGLAPITNASSSLVFAMISCMYASTSSLIITAFTASLMFKTSSVLITLEILETTFPSRVFFELDCDLMPFESEKPCQYGLVYSSVMGRGTASIVEDVEEKMKAMTILMKTQTGKDFEFHERLVSIVTVIRIDVEEYTAKHRPLPEKLR